MTLLLVTPPTDEVVTITELKVMLGITSDADDDLLGAMRDAVVQTIDPAAGGWLGRALAPQTWELRLPGFWCNSIRLPYPPTLTVDSVKYDDVDGVERTLVEGVDYRLFGLGGTGRTEILPVYQGSWPSTRGDFEAVRIVFTAGYTEDEMPQPIKVAIALGVKHMQSTSVKDLFLSSEETPGVRSRSWTVSENAGAVITTVIEGLLATYRVWDLP
jgi:uncharacterized phiE125 gp8 family phage protein